jgi:type IV secretion system protein VirB6
VACPPVLTGKDFLASTLAHIDCQAQTLGSHGYLTLTQPGSMASVAMLGLLTLFVGLFGFRLLFGPGLNSGDLVRDLLKVGIVLTLAISWPAWRTLLYDVTLKGPAEIAGRISPPSLPYRGSGGFAARLQNIDTGMIALTVRGTGRNVGALTEDTAPPAGFRGIALEDDTGFASSRLIFLSATIGSLAIVRFAAGLLLALTPLVAGLLLFDATRGLFSGWIRGLALTALGSVGITVVLAAELAVLEPWLQDALRLRELGYATPAAPTELLALTAAFALALLGMLLLLGKVAFQRGWPSLAALPVSVRPSSGVEQSHQQSAPAALLSPAAPSRAFLLSERVAMTVRQEGHARTAHSPGSPDQPSATGAFGEPLIGQGGHARLSGGSRSFHRVSAAAARRDARS